VAELPQLLFGGVAVAEGRIRRNRGPRMRPLDNSRQTLRELAGAPCERHQHRRGWRPPEQRAEHSTDAGSAQ
jgi:hypothetical protein